MSTATSAATPIAAAAAVTPIAAAAAAATAVPMQRVQFTPEDCLLFAPKSRPGRLREAELEIFNTKTRPLMEARAAQLGTTVEKAKAKVQRIMKKNAAKAAIASVDMEVNMAATPIAPVDANDCEMSDVHTAFSGDSSSASRKRNAPEADEDSLKDHLDIEKKQKTTHDDGFVSNVRVAGNPSMAAFLKVANRSDLQSTSGLFKALRESPAIPEAIKFHKCRRTCVSVFPGKEPIPLHEAHKLISDPSASSKRIEKCKRVLDEHESKLAQSTQTLEDIDKKLAALKSFRDDLQAKHESVQALCEKAREEMEAVPSEETQAIVRELVANQNAQRMSLEAEHETSQIIFHILIARADWNQSLTNPLAEYLDATFNGSEQVPECPELPPQEELMVVETAAAPANVVPARRRDVIDLDTYHVIKLERVENPQVPVVQAPLLVPEPMQEEEEPVLEPALVQEPPLPVPEPMQEEEEQVQDPVPELPALVLPEPTLVQEPTLPVPEQIQEELIQEHAMNPSSASNSDDKPFTDTVPEHDEPMEPESRPTNKVPTSIHKMPGIGSDDGNESDSSTGSNAPALPSSNPDSLYHLFGNTPRNKVLFSMSKGRKQTKGKK